VHGREAGVLEILQPPPYNTAAYKNTHSYIRSTTPISVIRYSVNGDIFIYRTSIKYKQDMLILHLIMLNDKNNNPYIVIIEFHVTIKKLYWFV